MSRLPLIIEIDRWFVYPGVFKRGTRRRKAQRLLMPSHDHFLGTVAHTTIGGRGRVARLMRK